ncbi:MAG: hypothetical protein HY332_15685 [Chloroflexi bacterium]|nr:hypothetical protein [Chloroflexota bacterium]
MKRSRTKPSYLRKVVGAASAVAIAVTLALPTAGLAQTITLRRSPVDVDVAAVVQPQYLAQTGTATGTLSAPQNATNFNTADLDSDFDQRQPNTLAQLANAPANNRSNVSGLSSSARTSAASGFAVGVGAVTLADVDSVQVASADVSGSATSTINTGANPATGGTNANARGGDADVVNVQDAGNGGDSTAVGVTGNGGRGGDALAAAAALGGRGGDAASIAGASTGRGGDVDVDSGAGAGGGAAAAAGAAGGDVDATGGAGGASDATASGSTTGGASGDADASAGPTTGGAGGSATNGSPAASGGAGGLSGDANVTSGTGGRGGDNDATNVAAGGNGGAAGNAVGGISGGNDSRATLAGGSATNVLAVDITTQGSASVRSGDATNNAPATSSNTVTVDQNAQPSIDQSQTNTPSLTGAQSQTTGAQSAQSDQTLSPIQRLVNTLTGSNTSTGTATVSP